MKHWSRSLLLGAAVTLFFAPTAVAEERTALDEFGDPVLEGAELKAHERAVKILLHELRTQKNRVVATGHIERLGKAGGRVNRDALIAFATGNKNQEYVTHAFNALANIRDKATVAFLCGKQALTCNSFLVQFAAAEALANTESPDATKTLLKVVTNKRTKIKVISAAAVALARCGRDDPEAVKVLLEYSEHRMDTIRAYTLQAIGYLGTKEADERLLDVLANSNNTRSRESAAMGMGNSRRAVFVPALENAIKEDGSHGVRMAANTAIGKIQGGD